MKVIDRKDLISEADLDDLDDMEGDTEIDTQVSIEDYDDIIQDFWSEGLTDE